MNLIVENKKEFNEVGDKLFKKYLTIVEKYGPSSKQALAHIEITKEFENLNTKYF